MASYTYLVVFRTTGSPLRRLCKPSQRANRPRTFLTSTMLPQINHPDLPPHKYLPPYLRPQTLSRALRRTHSMISSPFSEIWVPRNRRQHLLLQPTCSIHSLHCNLSSNRTHSADWDWVAWLPLLRSLHHHRNSRKSRRKICWASSRAVQYLSCFVCTVASPIQMFSRRGAMTAPLLETLPSVKLLLWSLWTPHGMCGPPASCEFVGGSIRSQEARAAFLYKPPSLQGFLRAPVFAHSTCTESRVSIDSIWNQGALGTRTSFSLLQPSAISFPTPFRV